MENIQPGWDSYRDSEINRWKFDDNSDSSTAIDSTGSNDGTISGATYTNSAQQGGYALDFSGSDIVEVTNTDVLTEFSYTLWVYPRSLSGQQTIIGQSDMSNSRNQRVMIDHSSTNTIEVVVYDGSNSYASIPSSELSTNTWNLIGASFSHDTNEHEIFLNGESKDKITVTSAETSLSNITIGATYNSDSLDTGFDGIVDDPRYWGKYLDEEEMSSIYRVYEL